MYQAKGATGGVGRGERVAIGMAGALLVAVAAINLVPIATLPVPSARPAVPSQPETFPGDTVRVWIVDLDSTLFWIQGTTHTDATDQLVREIEQTIDSFQFE